MSAEHEVGTASPEKSTFTAKEEEVLKAAWTCLKSPPEVDYEKLRVAAAFNTVKTTQNTWAKIKKKLNTFVEANADPEAPKDVVPVVKKKGTANPKKRGKNTMEVDDEDDDENPSRSAKKTRKTTVKAETDPFKDDEDENPFQGAKKPRKTTVKAEKNPLDDDDEDDLA
ncbi:hypothetical protein MBLNU459_g5382t1 [Dothideomycetes sp. NU459]